MPLLIFCLCLTACGKRSTVSEHTTKPSRMILNEGVKNEAIVKTEVDADDEENADQPGDKKRSNTDSGVSSNTVASQETTTDQSQDNHQHGGVSQSVQTNQNKTAGRWSTNQTLITRSSPAPVRAENILDRMRRGFTLPRFDSKDVDNYLRWNTSHDSYLNNLFARAKPFLHHIVNELEARNMPMELALLPAIESAYKPDAVSKSKAAGLWQFVPSTGKEFGLDQTWWYDGRLDAIRATTAALDYLEQLNAMFDGDWFLTLAAYNGGPGTINRALAANKRKGLPLNFKSLRLRSETRRYIPKLIALRRIIQEPHRYNVELPYLPLEPSFAVINLDQQIDLRKFAKESNTDIKQLRHLNASYKRWATPPQGRFALLVPQPHKLSTTRLEQIARSESGLSYIRYQIRNGDNLGSIAARHSVSTTEIRKANQLKSSFIRAGHTLLIPKVDAINSSSLANLNTGEKLTHTVRAGDTLWSISRRYNVAVKQLMDWNHLAVDQILRLNQQLLVLLK